MSCCSSFASLVFTLGVLAACGGGGGGEGEGEGDGALKFPALYTATVDFELVVGDALDNQTSGTYALVASFARDGADDEGSYTVTAIQVAGRQDEYTSGEGGVVHHCVIEDLVGPATPLIAGSLAVAEVDGALMFLGSLDWSGYGTETCEGQEPTPDAPLSLHVTAPDDRCGDVAFVTADDVDSLHYADSVHCVQPNLDDVTVTIDWTADAS